MSSEKWFSLKNRKCVVLGSEGLLGKACVRALRDSGADRVYSLDRNAPSDKTDFFEVDATSPDDLEKVFKKLAQECGNEHEWVFINISYPRTKAWGTYGFDDVSVKEWNENVELHLGSAFHFAQQAVRFMRSKSKKGTVIQFGSIYGVVGPDLAIYEGTAMKNPVPYAAIKAGIAGLTRYVSSVYGSDGIRANTVSPGGVEDRQPDSFKREYSKRTPLGRMATADEIAGVVAFLAGPAAAYISGQEILVDGGWTAR